MGDMWAELGRRLTDRRATALALPGVLYLAAAVAAYTLGWTGAWDVERLVERITDWTADPRVDTLGGQVLVFAAVVAGSTAVGLIARGLGWAVERLWTAADWERWPPPLRGWTGRWVRARRARWDQLREEVEGTRHRGEEAAFTRAYDRMARISPERPRRPTWCGDRIGAVRTRLARDHHADLAVLWPHLWLVLPEEERVELVEAREGLVRATGLAAWAMLYLPLAVWWWPAALVTAALAGIAWVRTRSATGTYATLVEATVRLHATELADRVGVTHDGGFGADLGERLTLRLRASMPPVHRPEGSDASKPEAPAQPH